MKSDIKTFGVAILKLVIAIIAIITMCSLNNLADVLATILDGVIK